MPYPAQVYRLFIASPSDVAQERAEVRSAIAHWNAAQSEQRGLVLLPVSWETHAVPQMGVRPQEHINETVLRDCDILIGVFWGRMGTDAGGGLTGTEEEIHRHLATGRKAHLYFSTQPLPHDVDTEQLARLRAFKADIQRTRSGLYAEYSGPDDFKSLFRRHLDLMMNGMAVAEATVAVPAAETQNPFNENAAFILKKATQSEHALVIVKSFYIAIPGGPVWETSGNGQLNAALREAIDELVERGLLRDHEGMGEKFQVTTAGFKLAANIPDDFGAEREGDGTPAS